MDDDDDSDDLYSVTSTDPTQVAYCDLSTFAVSSSSPAPGQPNDKMSESVTESDMTREPYWSLLSLISPCLHSPLGSDTNEPNWLFAWSPEELQQMQKEDKSVIVVLRCVSTKRPHRAEMIG